MTAATAEKTSKSSEGGKAKEPDAEILCPYCGDNVPNLLAIDAGLRLRLQEGARIEKVPDAVCDGCFKMLLKTVSKGAALRAEQRNKEQNRLLLWRSRVQLVKKAKSRLAQKSHGEAAVFYEKYLRVLEIVYDTAPGKLSPSLFGNSSRAQEMTVITSVYWDLMRIYDTHQSYSERQLKAAEKLAEFVRFTPIFSHIIRKAESQARSAKNPAAFQRFLKASKSARPRCFIATAAFDGYCHPTVQTLCLFRDQRLRTRPVGRAIILLYYRHSPQVAGLLDRHAWLKPATRKVLNWVAQREFVRNRLSL